MTSPAEFRDHSEDQDWPALERWLALHGMTRDLVPPPRQFAGGLANLNYLISVDGAAVVLRRPPGGPLAEGASDMAREARVLGKLHDAYPLAPRSVLHCSDPDVLGAEFQLIEYREGVTMRESVPGGLDPAVLTGGYVGALARLHAIDVESAGMSDLGRPDGFVRRQVDGWERRANAAFDDDVPDTARHIVVWLRDNQPESARVSLLHNDFKFDNLIWDPDDGDVRAVVDWDMSTLGDPLFDLGVALSYWVHADDPLDLGQAPSLVPGFPDRRGLAAEYFSASGIEPVPLGFYLALARFRLAIAWQQMYVLHERGALAGPRYAEFNSLAKQVLAWTADSLDTELT